MDSVEDMRRNIIRRRLRAEIDSRKKVGGKKSEKEMIQDGISGGSFENKQVAEFEESLEKLAEMAKGRIKLNEFTTKDRENLLDLFVNNEKTLLTIYEVLFPKPSLKYTGLKGATDMINVAGHSLQHHSNVSGSELNATRLSGSTNDHQISMLLDSMNSTVHHEQYPSTIEGMLKYQSTTKHSMGNSNLSKDPLGLNQSDMNTEADSHRILKLSPHQKLNNPSKMLPSILPAISPHNAHSEAGLFDTHQHSLMQYSEQTSPQANQSP